MTSTLFKGLICLLYLFISLNVMMLDDGIAFIACFVCSLVVQHLAVNDLLGRLVLCYAIPDPFALNNRICLNELLI